MSITLKVQFLNHYCGDTKNHLEVRERMAWAETEVEVQWTDAKNMELAFLEGRGDREQLDFDRVWSFDGHYWAVVEATNNTKYHRLTAWYVPPDREKPDENGIVNFRQDEQRGFAWRAFEFRLMPRIPSKGFRAANPDNFRYFKPGKKVKWDDRSTIEPRAASYYQENLLVAGDTVYCRIDPPCIGEREDFELFRISREQRVFTPFGGMGDPLIDYDKAYAAALAVADPSELAKAKKKDRLPFFSPIEDYNHDLARRAVRAHFLCLFGQSPWLTIKAKEPKTSEVFDALHTLWQSNCLAMTDAVLDEAAEIMLDIAKTDEIRRVCQRWLDRPIVV
ncbi:hypothetical protein OIU34_23420 [Pararhizobium sp. BT-229]|uniref:hypothetical protein n=1 Tax=Pararhizobium sp. BT-229 TaxID=2986923 RepID=UPI0021F6F868|nr:hypothetical protein [Pararhizobium sp. BT-229]MCV9964847.1 hypothetical protein [Pararhizobium sp. BT-229]